MKFSVIGSKAYRDPHEANAEFASVAQATGKIPNMEVVEFDTTARVNEFYRVSRLAPTESGQLAIAGQFYARTPEEIFQKAGETALISYEKVNVFPYLEPAERPGRKGKAVEAPQPATPHG